MKRHTITLGASTSAGGKVISASSHGRINGVTIALEGDVIICPACKSQGKIKCIGPRIPETWNGKQVALENDLCICGCPTPPKLIPNQSLKYQVIGDSESSSPTVSRADNVTAEKSATFDDKYILIDESTGKPLPNIEYALRRSTGKIEFGTTDTSGHTHLLSASTESESIDIFL